MFAQDGVFSHRQQPRDNNANYKRGRRVVRNVIFKNALIPFTYDQFSEPTTLRCIVRMQLLCSRCLISSAFLLYRSRLQEVIFLLFWNFSVIIRLSSDLLYTLVRFCRSSCAWRQIYLLVFEFYIEYHDKNVNLE
jgi:hypothetical protein